MTQQVNRLATGGRIDRSRPVRFTLDGRTLTGFQGDTLASALLANGAILMGRSFKYHRPRGVLAAGVEEPNALLTLGSGDCTDPNVPATVTELFNGLVARRQSGWPTVGFDLMQLNSLVAPLLSAGFYYKTFMGPTRRSWMFYERFIRKAAGLGRAQYQRDPERYETRYAFTDVLVIGAGPAGLQAALTAGRSGKRVMLVEQDSMLGGTWLLERVDSECEVQRQRLESALRSLPNVEILTRTTAFGIYDGNTVGLLERRGERQPQIGGAQARQVYIRLHADSIVYATGATERPLLFDNNDRPGVMLASAVRAYLNRFAVLCGKQAVVVTNNDSAYACARDLRQAGAVVTVIDLRSRIDAALSVRAHADGVEVIPGMSVRKVLGRTRVKGVALGNGKRLDCDLVCMSGGWTPAVHLTSHGGIRPEYRAAIQAFVPGGYAERQSGVGSLVGEVDESEATPATPAGGKAFVDFQNDVTTSDLRIARQEGFGSVEHLKRYTTLGMGTDQGKTSSVIAIEEMARLRGIPVPEVGVTTFRPPFTPVAIGALAGRSVGQHFRPTRRTPLHDWHIAHGATMIDAGPWQRPWWYRWAGDSVATAYIAEMRHVREAVGLSDVSTLGKIEVQGPDAGKFLDRVYVNGFSNLAVGKARYGVMLTDDGAVLDDGTTTRFAAGQYFLTTTTAQAGEVMSWLEFLLQTAWTDLEVHVTSVTDEWAGIVIAGPRSRSALQLAFPDLDVSDERLPHMGALESEFSKAPLRLMRLSFSGELAYELYVPSGHGTALWEHLLARAAALDIRPYGLECLASLRIEKGHVAGLELDHRNTLDDLGLARMASRSKDYVGHTLRQRPALQSQERWSLVGIELLEPGKTLRGGAILFAAADELKGHGRGYITSVTWSTVLDNYIALGLYQGGMSHAGEEVLCAFPLKNEVARARITSPAFVDPAGDRLRG